MSTLTSNLRISLIDDVSARAGKISKALALAEKQTRALAAASKAGISERMATQLQRMGAGTREIERVTVAWQKYSRAQGLAANSSNWTKDQIRNVREWERANLAAVRRVREQHERSRRVSQRMGAAGDGGGGVGGAVVPLTPGIIGPLAAAYGAKKAVTEYASAERALTRIGITADATDKEMAGLGTTAHRIAQEVAMPYGNVVKGLDVLVAQGRNARDALEFLPAVARTASATGSEVDDIAKSADSVSTNFKIAGREMQAAFDIMAAGGKAGQFELKDMSRYLPSLGPAAAAVGFSGQKGLTDLVAMLQVMRKGSGTSEEAAGSMNNILQKMASEETTKRFKKMGVDLEAAFAKGKKEGRNLVEVFEEMTAKALKGDLSKLPNLINDMEFARGVRALMTYRGEWQKLAGTIQQTAPGSVLQDLAKVTGDAQSKLDRIGNTLTRTWQNLGRVIHDVTGGLAPLREMNELIDRIYNHDDKAPKPPEQQNFNRAVNQAFRGVDTPEQWEKRKDERAEADQRAALSGRIEAIDAEISRIEKALAGRPARNARIWGEKELPRLRAEKEGLLDASHGRDFARAELERIARQQAATRTRMGLGMSGTPQPIVPGMSSFGFGVHGSREGGGSTPTYRTRDGKGRAVTAPMPLPPMRPGSVGASSPTLGRFEDIFAPTPKAPSMTVAPAIDTTSITQAEEKAKTAGSTIEASLGVTVRPNIDTSSVDTLLQKIQQARAGIDGLGAAASRSSGIVRRRLDGNFADGD